MQKPRWKMNAPIQWLDDGAQIETFGHGLDAVLALGTPIVVVGALEDEAETFGHEPDLGGFAPAQQPKRDLSHAVVLGHVVHGLTPAIESGIERLLGGVFPAATALHRLEPLQAGILRLADGIIQVELRSKIPFAVVRVLAANVVGMQSEQCLVW